MKKILALVLLSVATLAFAAKKEVKTEYDENDSLIIHNTNAINNCEDYIKITNNTGEDLDIVVDARKKRSTQYVNIANETLEARKRTQLATAYDGELDDFDRIRFTTSGKISKFSVQFSQSDLILSINEVEESEKAADVNVAEMRNEGDKLVFSYKVTNGNARLFVNTKMWVVNTNNQLSQSDTGAVVLSTIAGTSANAMSGFMSIQYSDKDEGLIMGLGKFNASSLGFSYSIEIEGQDIVLSFYDFSEGTARVRKDGLKGKNISEFKRLANSLFTSVDK